MSQEPRPEGAPAAGGAAGAPAKPGGRQGPRTIEGVVVSAKMQKTITVEMVRLERHEKYGKYLRRKIRFKAHDEKGDAHEGDRVRLAQTRPISLTKRWRLVEVVARAKG